MTDKEIIFNNLSIGNLIFAKRLPDTDEIDDGHKNGPFIVIGRKDEYFVCLYATSKEKRNALIKLPKNNYNLTKDTYITSNIQLISIDDFQAPIYLLNCLSEKDMKVLTKTIYIRGFGNHAFLKEPNLELGDIIEQKHKYLIIGETDNNYITIKVKFNNYNMNYDFYYSEIKLLQKNQRFRRISFLSDEELNKCILQFRKHYNLKLTDSINKIIPNLIASPLKVGNLIIYKKVLYYLYYELGNKKLSFSVSRKQTPISQKITIGGGVYYANFGSKKDFDENERDVHLVSTATEEEREQIKKKRRKKYNYQKYCNYLHF